MNEEKLEPLLVDNGPGLQKQSNSVSRSTYSETGQARLPRRRVAAIKRQREKSWRGLVTVATVVIAVLLLYWPAGQSLIALWTDTANETYTHGFLIAATACWLLWRRRARWAAAETFNLRQCFPTACALLVTVLIWQILYRAGIQMGYLMLVPVLLGWTVAITHGSTAARACALPFGFLYFALPAWNYLNPVAQWLTIHVVRSLVRLTGIPAYFTDNIVQLPSGTFAIEGGCAGLHFIIVSLALATLLGELRGDGWRMRVRWLALALLIALVTNWLRVYTIIVVGHVTYMQSYLVRVSHYGYGWLLFSMAIALLMWIESRVPVRRASSTETLGTTGLRRSVAAGERGNTVWVLIAVAILSLPLTMNTIIDRRADQQRDADRITALPPNIGDWVEAGPPAPGWNPVQEGADAERRQRYERGDRAIDVYVAWYRDQRQRKKLGGYSNRLGGAGALVDQGFTRLGAERYNTLNIDDRSRRSVVWYQYIVDDRYFTSVTAAQLWYAWKTIISMRSPSSSVVALRSTCDAGCDAAYGVLADFVSKKRQSSWRITG